MYRKEKRFKKLLCLVALANKTFYPLMKTMEVRKIIDEGRNLTSKMA